MLYWLPRVSLVAFAASILGFGMLPSTADQLATCMLIGALGLGLFSLTLHVFSPEKL